MERFVSFWTPEKESRLKELLKTETRQDAADELGCHLATVKNAIKRLGIKYKKKTGSNFKVTRLWPAQFSQRHKEIITGCLLGDGSMDSKSVFRLKQSANRVEYVKWIKEELSPYTTETLHFGETERKGTLCKSVMCLSRKEKRFDDLRSKWYPDGIKIVPRDIELTPLLCAHWFVQDGSNRQDKREAIINTNSFTVDDVEFLVEMLRTRLHICCHWRFKAPDVQQPIIIMGNELGDAGYFEFLEMIRPHVTWECFAYKVDVSEASQADFSRRNKLTFEIAEQIRKAYSSGEFTQREIATQFGIAQATVNNIVLGKIHKHLTKC